MISVISYILTTVIFAVCVFTFLFLVEFFEALQQIKKTRYYCADMHRMLCEMRKKPKVKVKK